MAESQSHWRMQLNNLLQANPALGRLEWEDIPARGHQGPWTAVANIGGVSHGSGRGDSKAAARESAARAAVAELRRKLAERGRI